MGWCFALVNNRLTEIFFDKTPRGKITIRGHCYVDKSEYKTKKEQKWIQMDTAKVKLIYRKGKYRDKIGTLKM